VNCRTDLFLSEKVKKTPGEKGKNSLWKGWRSADLSSTESGQPRGEGQPREMLEIRSEELESKKRSEIPAATEKNAAQHPDRYLHSQKTERAKKSTPAGIALIEDQQKAGEIQGENSGA